MNTEIIGFIGNTIIFAMILLISIAMLIDKSSGGILFLALAAFMAYYITTQAGSVT